MKDYESSDVEHISNKELLVTECDVLIPAAMENQITKDNANDIKCSYIVEAANGPTTNEADEILEKRGIILVPDILANAGGVTVSYFEWVQNLQSLTWDLEDVNDMLKKVMDKAWKELDLIASENKLTYRIAAYVLAIRRISTATKLRGMFP